jgi:hypothetical protein
MLSTVSVVEKAQHEPQPPWFFTLLTTPFLRQSTEFGRSPSREEVAAAASGTMEEKAAAAL